MSTASQPCTFGICRRTTRHASGRCHDHRGQRSTSRTSRTSLPAPVEPAARKNPLILSHPDGSTTEQWADEDGLTHRADGPAEIEYDPFGGLACERWFERGSPHRRGGPAMIAYRPRGEVSSERYYLSGLLHRLDGPAIRVYDEDGSVRAESWHFRRHAYRDCADLARGVAEYSEEVIRDDLAYTVHADLVRDGADPYRVLEGIGAGISTAEGMTEYLGGTPAEWIRSYESAQS